jgi:DNA-binding beta-propeller fold protein YncE
MSVASVCSDRSVGSGSHRYRALAQWQQLPAGWSFGEVAGVAVNSRDEVFVFNRGEHPVIVFDESGRYLHSWGEGLFKRAHGVFIDPDDMVYLVDDLGHIVRKFTPDGRLLMTLGTGQPSDTGVEGMDFRTVKRSGPPFCFPTNLARAPDGSLYVADGYGNARIHHFTAAGRLLESWGEPGTGPGQFQIPHGIAIAGDGRIYVADRENSRVQIFSPAGEFLAQWTDVVRPMQVFVDPDERVFVVEVGWRAGVWPRQVVPAGASLSARLSIFTAQGELLARWGDGEDQCAVGAFCAPHDVCTDSRGSIYVGEVILSAAANRGLAPRDCHCLQKFVKE